MFKDVLRTRAVIKGILSGVVLLFLDLFTKWLAVKYFVGSYTLIENVLQLKLSYNPNIAFSLPVPGWIVLALLPVILYVITRFFMETFSFSHPATRWSLILIFAGALGNGINRVWPGSVIDFISFSFFPSFNLADAYITVGAFLLVVFYGKIVLHGK